MIVCVCRNVSDRDIRRAIAEGARSVTDIADALDAGTCCGLCRETTEELLGDAGASANNAGSLTYAA
ncbi:MAG: (2Fe-2S)-binding protein [Pseudomonadales bacterium]|nr:(2Fe-2S)-binding protein [Pseudomonadales bacterium]